MIGTTGTSPTNPPILHQVKITAKSTTQSGYDNYNDNDGKEEDDYDDDDDVCLLACLSVCLTYPARR